MIFLFAFGLAVALAFIKDDDLWRSTDWRDYVALSLFAAFTFWIVGPSRRDGANGSDLREETGYGLVFRFGKSLNRIFRHLSGRA